MCDCTNSYSCPCSYPGSIPQPFHLPGYLGHIPTMRDRIGGSYGALSHQVLEDPCAVAAPCPILQSPSCFCCPFPCNDSAQDRFCVQGCLAPRNCRSDVYRPCEPMHDSYKGHIPAFFGCKWSDAHGRGTFGKGIYVHDTTDRLYGSKFIF